MGLQKDMSKVIIMKIEKKKRVVNIVRVSILNIMVMKKQRCFIP